MSNKARHAVERFPDLAQAIKQYSADNRFFRGLCEDYGEAIEILRHWEKLDRPAASKRMSKRIAACRELIEELEQEILQELQLWNDG